MNLFSKLREMNVLLIDDDEWVRDSLNIFFETKGCNLKTVETAEAGMAEISRQIYDILIIDYHLPGIDGLEFLKKIQLSCPNVLKILISAYGNRETFSGAVETGTWDIIEKPFNMGTIKAALARVISDCKGGLER